MKFTISQILIAPISVILGIIEGYIEFIRDMVKP